MNFNSLGNSNIKISKVSFGAWAIGGWMWGGSDEKDAIDAIASAIDLGMTTIDTAPIYGFGKSESLVGKVIKDKRDKVQLLTKYGLSWETDQGRFYFNSKNEMGKNVAIHKYSDPKNVIIECEKSLERLGTDYIDLYQIHWHDPTTPIENTMEAVIKLKEQGKIRAAGVCNYTAGQMKTADRVIDIETNQVPYSMVLRDIEDDVVPYCLETGKGILAYSPLQRGVLTGKITSDYMFNEGDHRPSTPFYQEPNLSRINKFLKSIQPLANDHQLTLAQMVICWTIQQPAVNSALVGARNPTQVKENAKAGEVILEKSVIEKISKELSGLSLNINV